MPLARCFLAELDPSHRLHFGSSAERALVSLRYQYRNVNELRDVIELATHVVDGVEIRAEHIFGGMLEQERPPGQDLTGLGIVQSLAVRGRLGVLRAAVLASFVAVIGVCLVAPSSVVAGVGNGFIWWGWEPAVFALFLLAGPIWCTVCPLSSAGRAAQSMFTLGRSPPQWLKAAGVWIATVGFFVILWVEHVFHMTERAFPTGWMLLGLIAASVVCCTVYQREVWCRHLCPLGRLAVALAPAAPLAVTADRRVCSSTCTTHDCYRGVATVPGCTVFHHPQMVNQAHHCKLCLDCLRTCPHGSAALYLRPPLAASWRLGSGDGYAVPFALAVFLLAPVFLAAQSPGPMATASGVTVAGVTCLVVAAFISALVARVLHGREQHDSALVARLASAFMVLGWGPLMAVQMGNIDALGRLQLVVAEPGWWTPVLQAITVMDVTQVAFVLAATLLAAVMLWRTRARAKQEGARVSLPAWWTLRLVVVAYATLAIALSLRG